MNTPNSAALYSTELLGLAVRLADFPLEQDMQYRGSARSRSCGSEIAMALDCDDSGAITRLGLQAKACAVGQAAAALFAESAAGHDSAFLADAARAIDLWLSGRGDTPDWPGIEALEVARRFEGRHQAILLPWRAALDALCNPARTR